MRKSDEPDRSRLTIIRLSMLIQILVLSSRRSSFSIPLLATWNPTRHTVCAFEAPPFKTTSLSATLNVQAGARAGLNAPRGYPSPTRSAPPTLGVTPTRARAKNG